MVERKCSISDISEKFFKDSNGDGSEISTESVQKLHYLKELGVNVLWISPMLESPQDDNGYDISDYRIYRRIPLEPWRISMNCCQKHTGRTQDHSDGSGCKPIHLMNITGFLKAESQKIIHIVIIISGKIR